MGRFRDLGLRLRHLNDPRLTVPHEAGRRGFEFTHASLVEDHPRRCYSPFDFLLGRALDVKPELLFRLFIPFLDRAVMTPMRSVRRRPFD